MPERTITRLSEGYTKRFLLTDIRQTAFNMLPFVSKIRDILISLRHSDYHIDDGYPEESR